MVQLKICGNHCDQDMLAIQAYLDEIDYWGFIFTPVSRRLAKVEQVTRWMSLYPSLKEKGVAVFLDQSLEEITSILQKTSLSHVQLHGKEPPNFCQELRRKLGKGQIWKMIPVNRGEPFHEKRMKERISSYLPVVDVLLLDTKVAQRVGGTGLSFDWSVLPPLRALIDEYNRTNSRCVKLFVAGGISPVNVGTLLKQGVVDGVDLASGVETDGCKDLAKIQGMIDEVKKGVSDRA